MKSILFCAAASVLALTTSQTFAQTAAPGTSSPEGDAQASENATIGEIIVTAQKRAQSINDVPLSITAATGEELELAGIRNVNDLGKITPGFSVGNNALGVPIYTLRGVGYNDNALAARPAVSVYLDEAPLPFAVQAIGASLDVERVEVLKGPQGTLFGNNATGGAVNYVAAKPTSDLEVGASATYGRFNETSIEAYASGPLTNTLSARVAFEHEGMSGWQYSLSRPDDTLGKRDFTNMRGILLWEPSSDLTVQLTANRWLNRGDTQATQVTRINPQINVPAIINLTQVPSIVLAPNKARVAEWRPGVAFDMDNRFFQTSLRADLNLSDRLTLTSLTNYVKMSVDRLAPAGGTSFQDGENGQNGRTRSFSEELRIAGDFGDLNALLGFVYSKDRATDNVTTLLADATLAYAFVNLGAPLFKSATGYAKSDAETYAAFGNVEYKLTPELTVQGGVRYTKSELDVAACTRGDANTATVFQTFGNALRAGAGLAPIAAAPAGSCLSLFTDTASGSRFLTPGEVLSELNEDNVSWRAGIQYEPRNGALLYANVAKGYKAGGFSPLTAFSNSAYVPAKQESVLAYEAGFKLDMLDQAVQLNGALFYMDYRDKQVLGNRVFPIVGNAVVLANIPKSRIYGAELSIAAVLADGLEFRGAGSYTDTKITAHYTDSNANSVQQDFYGTELPYAPRWQLNGNVTYKWAVTDKISGFASVSESYQSRSYSFLGEVPIVELKGRALTDLQVGVEAPDGAWRAYIWGRNVFNEFYWTGAARIIDTSVRWAAMPATYGLTLSFKMR